MSEQQKMERERAALQARIAALEAGQDSLILVRDEYKRMADEYRGKWAALLARASLPVGVPDGYALVPVEPTPEMVRAAEEAHMPFGDMDIALRMAILSAPSAQPAAEQSAPGEVEEVEVVGWLGGNGYHPIEKEATGAPFALMTVAQHKRLMAAEIQKRFDGNEQSSREHREELAQLAARDAGDVRALVEALEKIEMRADAFIEDERDMPIHSVEMVSEIAKRALATYHQDK